MWVFKHDKKIILSGLGVLACLGLLGCQPKQPAQHDESQASITTAQHGQEKTVESYWIEAKTRPMETAQKRVCEEEGCTDYAFQTIQTNHQWIDQYFEERIKKAYPVAFMSNPKNNAEQEVAENKLSQASARVRYMGQNQAIASFELSTRSYNAGAAHGSYHNEYVNFDLKNKKRISVDQLIVSGQQDALKNAVYNANLMWLSEHNIEREKFQLSDNFYYNGTGLVFVYPLYELASYAEGITELAVPFIRIKSLIRPQYLPQLPEYSPEE